MHQIVNSRGSWNLNSRTGLVQIAATPLGHPAPVNTFTFNNLQATEFAALMSLLNSGDMLRYDAQNGTIFAPQ